MANHPRSNYPDIGVLGEDLVAQWLESTGWVILQRRYSCRWGEIDIIAENASCGGMGEFPLLAFVEVKTRSLGNWDAGGRSAIAPQKQVKLGRTAMIFLAGYPEKANYPCRFDVAIVSCQKTTKKLTKDILQQTLASSSVDDYLLVLQEYIPAAFDFIIDNG